MYKPVNGDGAFLTGGNGVNGELGPGVYVAAHKDVGFSGLVGQTVGNSAVAPAQLNLAAFQQIAPLDALTDGQEHPVAIQGDGVVFVVGRSKLAACVPNRGTALEYDALDFTVFREDFLGAPAAADGNALVLGFGNFFCRCRHLFSGFQAEHGHGFCTAPSGGTGHINGNIAAADYYSLTTDGIRFVCAYRAQELHSGHNAFGIFTGNVGLSAALTANGNVEGFVAFLTQLIQSNILANFDAAANFHAHQLQNFDFRINDVLFQLEAGDAVTQHTAGLFVLFKDHRPVTLFRQIECAAQSGRACANNGNFFIKFPDGLGNDLGRNVPHGGVQILPGDKFLDFVNGNCLVNGATSAGIFAAAIADVTADSREGVVFLNQGQSFGVLSLGRQLQIALYGDVSRTGGFTGSGTGIVAVDPVFVPVINVPFLRTPLDFIRQFVLGIDDGTILGAKLLTQLHRTGRAVFHAAAAGYTVFRFHLGNISAAAHVGGVEQLGGSQSVAHVDITVADCENLLLTVNVGDLVDEAVFLCLAEDFQGFFVADVAAPVGFHHIVRHIANGNAPIFKAVAAAFLQLFPGHPAGAGRGGKFVVFFQPVGDMLNVNGCIFRFNGFFYRNDMHTDSCASGRHHGGNPLQRQEGHSLKEGSNFRMLVNLGFAHVEKFTAAGNKPAQHIALFMVGILPIQVFPVVFQKTDVGHLFKQRFQFFCRYAGHFHQLLQCFWLSHLHFQGHIRHFVGYQTCQSPVFRIFTGDTFDFSRNPVGDFSAQGDDLFPGGMAFGEGEV